MTALDSLIRPTAVGVPVHELEIVTEPTLTPHTSTPSSTPLLTPTLSSDPLLQSPHSPLDSPPPSSSTPTHPRSRSPKRRRNLIRHTDISSSQGRILHSGPLNVSCVDSGLDYWSMSLEDLECELEKRQDGCLGGCNSSRIKSNTIPARPISYTNTTQSRRWGTSTGTATGTSRSCDDDFDFEEEGEEMNGSESGDDTDTDAESVDSQASETTSRRLECLLHHADLAAAEFGWQESNGEGNGDITKKKSKLLLSSSSSLSSRNPRHRERLIRTLRTLQNVHSQHSQGPLPSFRRHFPSRAAFSWTDPRVLRLNAQIDKERLHLARRDRFERDLLEGVRVEMRRRRVRSRFVARQAGNLMREIQIGMPHVRRQQKRRGRTRGGKLRRRTHGVSRRPVSAAAAAPSHSRRVDAAARRNDVLPRANSSILLMTHPPATTMSSLSSSLRPVTAGAIRQKMSVSTPPTNRRQARRLPRVRSAMARIRSRPTATGLRNSTVTRRNRRLRRQAEEKKRREYEKMRMETLQSIADFERKTKGREREARDLGRGMTFSKRIGDTKLYGLKL